MYCKLFASLYQGTLRGRSHEILVFTNLLATCDKEGFVDKHFRAIAEEVGLTIEEVKRAIQSLESPDIESRSQELNGCRLERLEDHREWGWRIVNYVKYSKILNEEERREYNRIKQAEYRASKKKIDCQEMSMTVIDKCQTLPACTHIDVDVHRNIHTPTLPPHGSPSDMPSGAIKALSMGKTSNSIVPPLCWEFTKMWRSEFANLFGEDYLHQGKKDDIAVDKLTSNLPDINKHREILRVAWMNAEDFDYKHALTISGYLGRFNQIKMKALGKTQKIIVKKPNKPTGIFAEGQDE